MNNLDIVVAYMICKQQKIYGKVALQKLLYFVKEVGVPIEANYFMHIFGPFSLDIANRYRVFTTKGILVKSQENWGESFIAGENTEEIKNTGRDFLNLYQEKIDFVLNKVGELYPIDLELYATIHYIIKEHVTKGQRINEIKEVEVVREVVAEKGPKFRESDVKKCYSDIMKWFLQEE